MKRDAKKKRDSRQVLVWFPKVILPFIEQAVERLDTDRSKFIRAAVREKLAREGTVVGD